MERYFAFSLDLLCIANTRGEFIRLNPEWEKVLGYTLAELEGRSFLAFVHPEDMDATVAAIAGLDAQMEVFSIENRYRCKDNSYRWIEWRAKTQGEIIYAVARDITERKQNEQKLADYTLKLEHLYHQLDEEINKARLVHERILPVKLPEVPGISLVPYYQPAQTLGGDFYDVLHSGGKLIFYLSDVSGHGLDGAMLSVFVKHTIKSYISFTPAEELTPAAILRHLAVQFGREDYPDDLFVCLFMAVLDLDSMELVYCAAGFQDVLLVQLGSGEKRKLENEGMFISSYLPLEILKLQENSITLTPGSTIFCNTDGLTEQESNGTYYRDRLPDIFFQKAHQRAHLIAQAVVDDFRQFNNNSLQGKDDITFLVLQLEPVLKQGLED